MQHEDKLISIHESFNWLRTNKIIKTQIDFATLIGSNRATISRALSGDPKYLTDNIVEKAAVCVDNYKRESNNISQSSIEVSSSPGAVVTNRDNNNIKVGGPSAIAMPHPAIKQIPTIPIHAYRAVNFDVMEYFAHTTDPVKMSPIIMQFPGTDCYYFVNSEDMSPHLRTNDLLCLSRLPDGARVTNGDICIINTKTQGLLERFVYDDGDALLVKSSQPRWTDMRIPKDEIFNIFRILGGIRTNI